jgi:hypothetical protein
VLHGDTVARAVQKRSVESFIGDGAKLMQKFGRQSSSDRQGEQKLPSPTHTPARGTHTLRGLHLWPAAQSPSLLHSGVHTCPSQCWYAVAVGGQSSSLSHAAPAAGVQTGHWAAQVASNAQFALPAHCSAQ